MNASLVTSFVRKPVDGIDGDTYWVHIEQSLPESDTATIGEVASLVDSLYGVDPCNIYDGSATITQNPINQTDAQAAESHKDLTDPLIREARIAQEKALFFQNKVKEYANLTLCVHNSITGDYQTQIMVGLSHPGEHYNLVLSNGIKTKSSTFAGEFSKTYKLDRESSIALPFPVIGKLFLVWDPVVAGPYGYQHGPKITLTGRTLTWDVEITGALTVRYDTIYDVVDITIVGANGITPECKALCFYHGLVDEIDLEAPAQDDDATQNDRLLYCPEYNWSGDDDSDDKVTCFEEVTEDYICECSGSIAYSIKKQVVVPCPSTLKKCDHGMFSDAVQVDQHFECSVYMGSRTVIADYVSCPTELYNAQTGQWASNGENSILGDPEYYAKRCCHGPDPNTSLPRCQTKWEKNRGTGLDPDVKKELERDYGSQLLLIPVSPDDGDCGYIKTVISDTAKSCCVEVTQVEIADPLGPVSPGGQIVMTATGGKLPYTWRGNSYLSLIWQDGQSAGFRANPSFCGSVIIFVQDACAQQASQNVTSTNGVWVAYPVTDRCSGPLKGYPASNYNSMTGGGEQIANGWKVRFDQDHGQIGPYSSPCGAKAKGCNSWAMRPECPNGNLVIDKLNYPLITDYGDVWYCIWNGTCTWIHNWNEWQGDTCVQLYQEGWNNEKTICGGLQTWTVSMVQWITSMEKWTCP